MASEMKRNIFQPEHSFTINFALFKKIFQNLSSTHSAGAVEYTDYISAEG